MSGYIHGYDIGTKMGWGVLDSDGERVDSGVWDLSPAHHQSHSWRYVMLARHVRGLLKKYPPQAAFFELVEAHKGTYAAQMHGSYRGQLLSQMLHEGVNFSGVTVANVKRAATGKGRATKAQMVAAALEQWAHGCATDDEADALFTALAGLRGQL